MKGFMNFQRAGGEWHYEYLHLVKRAVKMEMKVVVRESTMVRPAEETPAIKLWNSILDLTAPNLHMPMLYFYRPNGAPNFFDPKIMKDALSRALVAFYPMGGRFKQGEDGRIEINCQGQGALFLEAESNAMIDDFTDFAPRIEFMKLIPLVDYSLGIDSYPLLVSQVTYFKCGGVSLGVCYHLRVLDGVSAIHFINTWSDMARGLDITLPPFIDRTLLRAHDPPQTIFEHVEYRPQPTLNSPLQVEPAETKIACSIFKLTRNQLDVLKAKSKKDGNTISYSSFEILSSHVWKCVCKARALADDLQTRLDFVVDGRDCFQPPLPPGYFGNVIFKAAAIAPAVDIQLKPLGYAASVVHDVVMAMNNDYLKSALHYLEHHEKPMVSVNYTNIRIISWDRFPIQDTDFGWGQPIFMGPAFFVEGLSVVLPSPIEDGSLSIVIGLEVEQMKVFSSLFYAL